MGLLFATRGDFPFAECSCQKLVLGRRCDGTWALSQALAEGGRISYRYNYARVPREQLHGRYALEGEEAASGAAR